MNVIAGEMNWSPGGADCSNRRNAIWLHEASKMRTAIP